MLILIIFAFLSGIVTILSPCILPVLPIVLTGSFGNKSRPYGIVLGFILSFVIFSLTLSWIINFLNIPGDSLRILAIIFITFFGLIMFIPSFKEKFEIFISKITRSKSNNSSKNGFKGGVFIGLTLGIVWTPCVGPIMASVIALAATQTVDVASVLIILFYSIGTSIPMFAVILGGRTIIKKIPFLTKNPVKIQRGFGILMIIIGLSIGLDLDRKFQSVVLKVFPNYGAGLTVFETIEPVQKALKSINRSSKSDLGILLDSVNNPKNATLGNYGLAPEFITNPLGIDLQSLKGKVVIVDFWTYSCINCIRTIPHLRSWYETYKDYGLEIVGVHTPEFAFESTRKNVNKAIKDLGITWPVIQDNNYKQWISYNNRYWPAKYILDVNGVIRYFHFGEDEYSTLEKVIRKLLLEAGIDLSSKANKQTVFKFKSKTPEIYLGYGRTSGFSSNEEISENREITYTSPKKLNNGQWSLTGNWLIKKEFIVPKNSGELELNFSAKNVFIVIEPESTSGGVIEVLLDGKRIHEIQPTVSKLYQLVDLKRAGSHNLKLRIKGDLRLFAFTFG
ncbi:MAG: redoxin domain-containing protein [Spirochaetaceae bacterium]